MCHNSVIENEQIEKCIESGMPTKIVKTIKSTMRKRAANEEINNKLQKQREEITSSPSLYKNIPKLSNPEEAANAFVFKCPFGHGKFTTPAAATVYVPPLTPPPTTADTSLMDNELNLANNNNNLHKRFPQISQFKSTITGSKTLEAGNSNAITNLNGHSDDDNKKLLLASRNLYDGDILAKSTQLTRQFVHKMQQAIKRLQSKQIYTLLTKTTQPAHLVVIGIVTFVLMTVWPEFIDGEESKYRQQQHITSGPTQETTARKNDMLALIAYLGAFSTHFGAQIWMTFVSGLSLYFSLPRHIFGQCQQILFPKYFAMNAALSITMIILYIKYFVNSWTLSKCIQLGSLSLTGAIELLVRLYLAPPLLSLMQEKYKIEGTIGSGKEVGSLVQGDLAKCPHYQRIHKAFRRTHMMVAIGNVITMAGSCLQLYNIAGQLQITLVH